MLAMELSATSSKSTLIMSAAAIFDSARASNVAKFLNLYVRGVRLDDKALTFSQRSMAQIGQYALDAWKARTVAAIGPDDAPAKPLTRGWAIAKAKMMSGKNATSAPARWKYESKLKARGMKARGEYRNPANWHIRSNKRDYTVTGELMAGLTLRQVSDNSARARWTSLKLRNRASSLSGLQPFVTFAPSDSRKTVEFVRPIFKEMTKRIIIQKALTRG